VNNCFLVLGHSCPLTHTIADGRGGAGSIVTVPTTNRFSQLEVESPLLDPHSTQVIYFVISLSLLVQCHN